MARLRFRDRFFTPPVARAITSPAGILLAGAGISVGIVAGLPIAAIAGLGALAWAGRVAVAIPRNPLSQHIDPFTLGEPWRHYVKDALQAQAKFESAVGDTREGPLRDRLHEVAERIRTGIDECWRVARHGQALADARAKIDVADVTRQLSEVSANAKESWAAGSPMARTAEALEAQLGSAARMDEVVADAQSRLRLLDARLDEAVARSIELSVGAGDLTALSGLGNDIDNVVTEMEALRQALDEAGGTPATGSP